MGNLLIIVKKKKKHGWLTRDLTLKEEKISDCVKKSSVDYLISSYNNLSPSVD